MKKRNNQQGRKTKKRSHSTKNGVFPMARKRISDFPLFYIMDYLPTEMEYDEIMDDPKNAGWMNRETFFDGKDTRIVDLPGNYMYNMVNKYYDTKGDWFLIQWFCFELFRRKVEKHYACPDPELNKEFNRIMAMEKY